MTGRIRSVAGPCSYAIELSPRLQKTYNPTAPPTYGIKTLTLNPATQQKASPKTLAPHALPFLNQLLNHELINTQTRDPIHKILSPSSYVCMYVCIYVGMHVCIYVCMYVCMSAYMYGWMHACMHACMCIYTHMYICFVRNYMYMYVNVHVYMCMYIICVCVHIYIHASISVYIYTHT